MLIGSTTGGIAPAQTSGTATRKGDPGPANAGAPEAPPAAASPVRESDGYARRVEARRAAEDARLERFRADDLPLPAARALSAFASVAAVGDDSETASSLAGIDITV